MTDEVKDAEYDNEVQAVDLAVELEMLKQRARMIGVEFSNNIGLETLRARVAAKLEGQAAPVEEAAVTETETAEAAPKVKKESLRAKQMREQTRLIRVRISNMDPKKANLPGEIVTFANSIIGTRRKFIPFGSKTKDGYHIEYVLYKQLKRKKFLHVWTENDPRTGREQVFSEWVPEFAIEILPDLTPKQLADLAAQQLAANG